MPGLHLYDQSSLCQADQLQGERHARFGLHLPERTSPWSQHVGRASAHCAHEVLSEDPLQEDSEVAQGRPRSLGWSKSDTQWGWVREGFTNF